ncbi:hypothetical protein BDF20DRAFT_913051 [Mycotypha africana]|uniref:uncharacterized protein n=1 Tax=Mycotypha africana TaxID=64632 RepID=UPI00230017BF|nr:uncharacterized protein BDF20DRAFT_913051 [Mycotypha africana]KAI8979480.1 hypothetical protein BDF20DRAFT_913051 [Mycotypha africana]
MTVYEQLDMRPLEKFVFQVNSVLQDDQADDASVRDILDSESIYTAADLQHYLRSNLIRTSTYQSIAKSLKEKTFSLSIETTDGGYPITTMTTNVVTDENVDWIPADHNNNHWRHVIPLKTIEMDLYRANTFVMVASKKGKEKTS